MAVIKRFGEGNALLQLGIHIHLAPNDRVNAVVNVKLRSTATHAKRDLSDGIQCQPKVLVLNVYHLALLGQQLVPHHIGVVDEHT